VQEHEPPLGLSRCGHGGTQSLTGASLLGEAAFLLPDFQAFAYFVDGSGGFRY
jgi:hypothetical protein